MDWRNESKSALHVGMPDGSHVVIRPGEIVDADDLPARIIAGMSELVPYDPSADAPPKRAKRHADAHELPQEYAEQRAWDRGDHLKGRAK